MPNTTVKSISKSELVSAIAKETAMTKKDTEKFIKAFETVITDFLSKGYKIPLIPFGTFEVKHRKERKGKNPQTKEEIIIPARDVPVFRPGKRLKEAVNKSK